MHQVEREVFLLFFAEHVHEKASVGCSLDLEKTINNREYMGISNNHRIDLFSSQNPVGFFVENNSGQIIATSHDRFTPNGGLVG